MSLKDSTQSQCHAPRRCWRSKKKQSVITPEPKFTDCSHTRAASYCCIIPACLPKFFTLMTYMLKQFIKSLLASYPKGLD
jgi:hypothetical protein